MTNNNTKTAKIKNAHRKAFTTFCAMLAATAVITGIAVFTASATQIKSAPEKTSTSVTMAAKPTTTTTTTTTTSAVTTTTTKQTQATAETNKNGKHPGEAGYRYDENQQNAMATTTVKTTAAPIYNYVAPVQTAPVTTTTTKAAVTTQVAEAVTNANGKHPGEAGCNYNEDLENAQMTNAYGKHPGECGFGYDEARESAAVTNAYGKHPGEAGYCYAG